MSFAKSALIVIGSAMILTACGSKDSEQKTTTKVSTQPVTCEDNAGRFYDLVSNMQKLDFGRRHVDRKLSEMGYPSQAVNIAVGIYDLLDQKDWTDSEIRQFKYRFVSNACSK
jgi:hypothetical protein